MKKYIRPELFYEHFELSQHIADCGWEMQYANESTCAANTDVDKWGYEDTLFTSSNGACNLTPEVWQDYCYQNGADSSPFKVFAS